MKITQIPTPLLGGPSNGGSVSLRPALGTGAKGDTGNTGAKGDTGPQGPPGPGTGAGAWQPSTAYTANQVVQAPDGSMISRNASGTSRASFDATEQAAWTAVVGKAGTLAASALSDSFVKKIPAAGPAIRSAFTSPDPKFVAFREDIAGSQAYYLARHIGGGRWDCYELRTFASATTGHVCTQLRNNGIRTPLTILNDNDASITYSASGWSTITDASAYGGDYKRNSTAGATATWTVPSATTTIGLRVVQLTNGGYASVAIDGDLTRAKLLPTAQDEVNAGRLAASELTTNGGTIAPTTRLLSCYADGTVIVGGKDVQVFLADDLAAGATKSVVITVLGKKPTASSDVRFYLGGVTLSDASTSMVTNTRSRIAILLDQSSVWEYAMHVYVPAGTARTWTGNAHGYDQDVSATLYVDGKATTLTDGTAIAGSTIMFIRKSNLVSQDDGTTPIANVTVTYLIAADGLRVEWTIRWLAAGQVVPDTYTVMYPRNNTFSRVKNIAQPNPVDVVASDGSMKADAAADAMLLWQPSGNYGSMVHIPSPQNTVNGFPYSVHKLAVEDRTGGLIKKVYASRAKDAGESFAAGDVWRGGQIYSSMYFPAPDAILGAI